MFVNPVQEKPIRSYIYGVNKCEDQTIGFQFVKELLQQKENRCCNNIAVNVCIPVEVIDPIEIDSAEFIATNDPCYLINIIDKTESPDIELQYDDDDKVIGILVRFYKYESCCYPPQMAFKLYAIDETGCKFSLSTGLLLFK